MVSSFPMRSQTPFRLPLHVFLAAWLSWLERSANNAKAAVASRQWPSQLLLLHTHCVNVECSLVKTKHNA